MRRQRREAGGFIGARTWASCAVSILCLLSASPGLADEGGTSEAELVLAVSAAGEALGEGAERLGPLRSGRLRQGRVQRFGVAAPAGACIVAIAHAEPSVKNLDVSIARGRAELARDTSTSPEARARWCAGTEPVRLRVTVKAFRGHGRFGAAMYRVAADAPEARGNASAQGGSSALERLEARVGEVGAATRPVTPPRREELEEGQKVVRELPLEPGRCYRVVAAAEDGLEDLDLALVAPGGALVQEDGLEGPTPTLGVLRPLCPARPGSHRLVLRARRGQATVAWRVLGSVARAEETQSASRAPRFRVGGSGSGFLAERIRSLHARFGRGAQPITGLVTERLATNGRHRLEIEAEGGRCYVAIAAGVPSVRELDLKLVDPYGREAAKDDTRDAFPHARVCPRVGGRFAVELHMFNGYGPVGVQVFGADR